MTEPLPFGKLPAELLGTLLARCAQTRTDPRVVVGPGIGLDCAVLDFGDRYLVCKTDPITFATGGDRLVRRPGQRQRHRLRGRHADLLHGHAAPAARGGEPGARRAGLRADRRRLRGARGDAGGGAHRDHARDRAGDRDRRHAGGGGAGSAGQRGGGPRGGPHPADQGIPGRGGGDPGAGVRAGDGGRGRGARAVSPLPGRPRDQRAAGCAGGAAGGAASPPCTTRPRGVWRPGCGRWPRRRATASKSTRPRSARYRKGSGCAGSSAWTRWRASPPAPS